MNQSAGASMVRLVHRLVIPNSRQLADYLNGLLDILELCFPGDYLACAQILTLVDHDEQVCGGAMVVMDPGFRSLASIPGSIQAKVNEAVGSLEDVAEVNGVWVQTANKSPFVSFSFWCQFIKFLLATPKDKFLFTFDNRNSKMCQVATSFDSEILYSGPTLQLEGMQKPSDETIALVTRKSLITLQVMLERRGIGTPDSDEVQVIEKIKVRTKSPNFSRSSANEVAVS